MLKTGQDTTFMVSLLYYFGVLTLTSDRTSQGKLIFKIPNLVIRKLYVERIQEMLLPNVSTKEEVMSPVRYFNTTGPCNPEQHYTVIRPALISQGQRLVEQGRYFTIFAPRQAGKTTYFQLLFRQLQPERYTSIWLSFESLKTLTRNEFYEALDYILKQKLTQAGVSPPDQPINNQFALRRFFDQLKQSAQTVVLVIDEFEGTPDIVLSELMHTFREMYHQPDLHALHSLILVGVSTIAELVVSEASPFNVVEELQLPYFTPAEVDELIQQYVAEVGQPFEPAVIQAIYDNTRGQPGLVGGLCAHLVDQVALDRVQPVRMDHFYQTLQHFLTERFDKNISNIIRKAREKQAFMLQLLFTSEPIPFTVNEPNIAYLYAHGVVDNQDGYVDIAVPLYSKALILAFRPLINGETSHYLHQLSGSQ